MADKEIVIDHELIRNPQTITQVQEKAFKDHGLDMHANEVNEIIDDHKAGKRILKVKNTKYFTVPDMPWLKGGQHGREK